MTKRAPILSAGAAPVKDGLVAHEEMRGKRPRPVRRRLSLAPAPPRRSSPRKGGSTLPDERYVQRLEEQLSEAHATNGSLREQLGEATMNADSLNALRG